MKVKKKVPTSAGEMEETFDILIRDYFIEEKKYEEIYNTIPFNTWQEGYLQIKEIGHLWYSAAPPQAIKDYLKEKCEKWTGKKLQERWCAYTLVSRATPIVHCDYNPKEGCDCQVLLYIRGNESLNRGTGFYTTDEKGEHNLNTHIGFRENRAIFFDARVYHSPLIWLANDKSPRYSLAAQYKEIK